MTFCEDILNRKGLEVTLGAQKSETVFCAQFKQKLSAIKMTELVDIRLHHQIAHEIYRQQMMQRLPGMY